MPLIIGEVLFVNEALILNTHTHTHTHKKPALQKLINNKGSKVHVSNRYVNKVDSLL